MTKPILEIKGISKKFRIAHEQQPYLSLRDSFTGFFRGKKSGSTEEFWALKDVSFEVQQGESVGIIGKNGAGKSTLLKILSKITPPTEGRVTARGRVASLLEVGTGFHGELTGRENIFLNGSILGMKRKEILDKFDAIVDFSGVENFLDTPLKHFSTGMQLRLAFAVAAFLEPEILLIDEILAVGDAEFQKKCFGKMDEVSKSGRTILFVSHNMTAVQALCKKSVLIENGTVKIHSDTHSALSHYLKTNLIKDDFEKPAKANGSISIVKGRILKNAISENKLTIELQVVSPKKTACSIDFRLYNQNGTPVGFGSLGALNSNKMINLNEGQNIFKIELGTSHFANGSYFMGVDLTIPNIEYLDRIENILYFEIFRPSEDGFSRVFSLDWNYGALHVPVALGN